MSTETLIQRRTTLLDEGVDDRQIRSLVRDGRLTRVIRGAFVADAPSSHLTLIAALVPTLHPDSVVSHSSAAALWHLPLPANRVDKVHVTRPIGSGRRDSRNLAVHAGLVDASEVAMIASIPTTCLELTAVDCARTQPLHWAVAIMDAALRLGADRGRIGAHVDEVRGRKGSRVAAHALTLADPRAESPAESISRVTMRRCGIPAPELQYEIWVDGHFVARTDFAWLDKRTIGEVDGRAKYETLLRPGQASADAIMAEKRREQAIRQAGWQIVRWGWAQACDPALLGPMLRSALAR